MRNIHKSESLSITFDAIHMCLLYIPYKYLVNKKNAKVLRINNLIFITRN